jgi:hypothetical protein
MYLPLFAEIPTLTRRRRIPHRVTPHGRRCLFLESDVLDWMNGAELETIELHHGGRVVKPVENEARA